MSKYDLTNYLFKDKTIEGKRKRLEENEDYIKAEDVKIEVGGITVTGFIDSEKISIDNDDYLRDFNKAREELGVVTANTVLVEGATPELFSEDIGNLNIKFRKAHEQHSRTPSLAKMEQLKEWFSKTWVPFFNKMDASLNNHIVVNSILEESEKLGIIGDYEYYKATDIFKINGIYTNFEISRWDTLGSIFDKLEGKEKLTITNVEQFKDSIVDKLEGKKRPTELLKKLLDINIGLDTKLDRDRKSTL